MKRVRQSAMSLSWNRKNISKTGTDFYTGYPKIRNTISINQYQSWIYIAHKRKALDTAIIR